MSGKGGVGKSTVCAVLGRIAARLGKRVLVIQSDPNLDAPVNLHNLLGAEPFDTREKELHPGLWALKTDPDTAMRHALMPVIKARFLYDAFFSNEMVQGMADAIPGLREAFIVNHAFTMAIHGSRRRYDLVIWDAPPTGHLPLYLKAPSILGNMFKQGAVFTALHGLTEFLRQPSKVALCLVTLPEETPVLETLQLMRQVEEEQLGHVGAIVVNAFPEALLSSEAAHALEKLVQAPDDPAHLGSGVAATARRRLLWETTAVESVRALQVMEIPQLRLPWFFGGRIGLVQIDVAAAAWLDNPAVREQLTGQAEAAVS
ncbi:MAG: ArsA family ATPase [Candidatus Xenobia bacterium]